MTTDDDFSLSIDDHDGQGQDAGPETAPAKPSKPAAKSPPKAPSPLDLNSLMNAALLEKKKRLRRVLSSITKSPTAHGDSSMPAQPKIVQASTITLTDPAVPLEHRKAMLGHICQDASAESMEIAKTILDKAAQGNSEQVFGKKLQEVTEILEELKSGPLRPAVYIGPLSSGDERRLSARRRRRAKSNGVPVHDNAAPAPADGSKTDASLEGVVRTALGPSVRRVKVAMQNGDFAYPVVPDAQLADELECGDGVLVDAQGRALLYRDPARPPTGEQARLERRIDDERVEAVVRDHEPYIFQLSQALREQLDDGDVSPGAKLLVCTRRAFAFEAVPAADGLSHYRYLVRDPVPDVVLSRDVGNPPAFLFDLVEHLRDELQAPTIGRRYRLRRSTTKLLSGVSGSGKSLAIRAYWRLMYEVMSEHTGYSIEDLPPRVVRLRMPQVMSKWLGESDKNLDRFFDEVEQLADEKWKAPDGREYELPVLVICEEIDGLARARGHGDPIYDRIQTTGLERLDTNTQRLADCLATFLFTTNLPHLVDPAFLRRAGGAMVHFGRLDRQGFQAVLEKHLLNLPMSRSLGRGPAAEKRLLKETTSWLFSPNGHDPGQVEITLVGASTPITKYRRDFLTGALVDRAVQQAAHRACRSERRGAADPGMNAELLIRAFSDQIQAIARQLTPHNAENYLDLPDGARVGSVRRVPQPTWQPHQLERRGFSGNGHANGRHDRVAASQTDAAAVHHS